MPEVTFDPAAGAAFESHNGQPIEGPVPTEQIIDAAPSSLEEPVTDPISPTTEYTEPLEDALEGFNDVQRDAITRWKEQGIDARGALDWAISEESTLDQETVERFGHHLQDEDPAVVQMSLGALALAQSRPDCFDTDNKYAGVEWTQEQEHALVDVIGGDHTSEIINLNYRLTAGEIDRAQAFRYVAARPELQHAYMQAANAGLIVIHL